MHSIACVHVHSSQQQESVRLELASCSEGLFSIESKSSYECKHDQAILDLSVKEEERNSSVHILLHMAPKTSAGHSVNKQVTRLFDHSADDATQKQSIYLCGARWTFLISQNGSLLDQFLNPGQPPIQERPSMISRTLLLLLLLLLGTHAAVQGFTPRHRDIAVHAMLGDNSTLLRGCRLGTSRAQGGVLGTKGGCSKH